MTHKFGLRFCVLAAHNAAGKDLSRKEIEKMEKEAADGGGKVGHHMSHFEEELILQLDSVRLMLLPHLPMPSR